MSGTTNVNNRRVSFSSFRGQLAGEDGATFTLSGVKSFNYSHSMEPGEAEQNDAGSAGDTEGNYKCEGQLELFFKNSRRLIAFLGDGWMTKYFQLTAAWRETPDAPVQTVILYDCRLISSENNGSAGNEATSVTHKLRVRLIEENGKLPYPSAVRQLSE